MNRFSFTLKDIDQAAGWLIENSKGKKIITFSGEMGAGKTTLISAICKLLGVKNEVSSPTFSIVNEYQAAQGIIYHFDFYRIRNIQEAYDFGYEEYFYSDALCLIEWPEKATALLPEESLKVTISVSGEDSRSLSIA